MRKRFLSARGFTLIEVLVAFVVVTIGIAALLPMFSIGMIADTYVEDLTIALNLSQEKMEEIRDASSYASIDSFASARTNLSGDFSGFERAVTVFSNPKEVNVTVYWTAKGDEQSISLATLFADYDY